MAAGLAMVIVLVHVPLFLEVAKCFVLVVILYALLEYLNYQCHYIKCKNVISQLALLPNSVYQLVYWLNCQMSLATYSNISYNGPECLKFFAATFHPSH